MTDMLWTYDPVALQAFVDTTPLGRVGDVEDIAEVAEFLEVCRKHQKPIVIMEPVKGGMLANLKTELAQMYRELDPNASAASYAPWFAASLGGVMAALSGMSTTEQMEDNLRTFDSFRPISLSE